MKEFSGEIIGKVVTPVAWGSGEFRNLPLDMSGKYPVSLEEIPTGLIRLFVYDGAIWRPVLCDAEGYIQADIHKLRGHADVVPPHVRGVFHARTAFTVTAGQNYVDSASPAVGKIWVVTSCTFINVTAAGTTWDLYIAGGAYGIFLSRIPSPAANKVEGFAQDVYLDAGYCVRFQSVGAGVGDLLRLYVCGYEMYAP